jgi:DNA-binding winged helix-turn-helix (wHTH) protein/TolB-like protein/Flp pilus assembly protein TadD
MTDTASASGSISRFAGFVLDADRALLTRDGAPVALRPKTFALLSYLARHPGRVLPKGALLGAVWPGVVVNDESLSQCVRELRAALGDEHQALIRTVPRRGYLFDVAVEAGVAAGPAAPQRKRGLRLAGPALAGVALLIAALALFYRAPTPVPTTDTHRSIAVLPFTEGGGRSPLGDSVAEEVTGDLSLRPGLLLVSFASASAVVARESGEHRIGRALGVRHLLTGSLQREGEALEISAQLVSADDGALLWSERLRYARRTDWSWQRDIGSGVARALGLPVAAHAATPNDMHCRKADAFDAVVEGRHQLRRGASLVDLRRARAHFEQALAIEPDCASAWVGLARTHLDEVDFGWSKDRDAQLAQAEHAFQRALALVPDYPPALALSATLLRLRGDFDAALAGYQVGVAYNPSNAWAHARIAALKLRLGRPEEVLVHADMALRLSPFEPSLVGYSHVWAGVAEFYLGREEAAYERMRQAADAGASPSRFGALMWLASLDAMGGRQAQAAQHVAAVMQLDPGWTISKWRPITALTHPRLIAGRERFAEGMKKAGLPE